MEREYLQPTRKPTWADNILLGLYKKAPLAFLGYVCCTVVLGTSGVLGRVFLVLDWEFLGFEF